jgi:hypothetical protein
MFGMLDYRANKLYQIIFLMPWFFVRWVGVIGLPFVYYISGLILFQNRIFQVCLSILFYFIGGVLFQFFVNYIDKLGLLFLNVFVDVIPVDGRTKEQSIAVVKQGQQAIRLINLENKSPNDWSEDDLLAFKGGFAKFLYRNKINSRIDSIRAYYSDKPNTRINNVDIEAILNANSLKIGVFELFICNTRWQASIISGGIFAYLLISYM